MQATRQSGGSGGARIVVVGVGGGGGNAVGRMLRAGLRGVEFVVANTDQQALARSEAPIRVRLGEQATGGLGAGGDPRVGERAATESVEALRDAVRGADMVFVAAGMGGGTGTGAAPTVAQVAREEGALAVGIVTRPFRFEGTHRRRNAETGLGCLRDAAHTVIAIPNDRLLEAAERKATVDEAFRLADDVLRQGVQGISELITEPGLVNLDFADARAVMAESGGALMAMGQGSGPARAADAARMAIHSPLLDVSVAGARGILLNITGGEDLSLGELNEVADLIAGAAASDANVIVGAVIDPTLRDEVRVTVIATGLELTKAMDAPATREDGMGGQNRREAREPERGAADPAPREALRHGLAPQEDEEDLAMPPALRRHWPWRRDRSR